MITTIETERLILRPWKMEDANDLVEGLNNYEVAKNLTTPYPYTKDHAIYFINHYLQTNEDNYTFAIVEKASNKVIGGTSLEIDGKVGDGEI